MTTTADTAGADAVSSEEKIMARYLADTKATPRVGELVEGVILKTEKAKVFIDLYPFGTGVIYGREYNSAADVLRRVSIGDLITAKVVEETNRDGYMELSLMEARQALIWSEAEEAVRKKTFFELPVKEANKGGLMLEWQGIAGFLPASQLKPDHYPRVEDGDKDKILDELRKLVGQKITVTVITADAKEGKIIFSEKDSIEETKGKLVGHYAVGDVLAGEITGAVDFGVFVKVEEGLEGLVHISELDWGLVEDPRKLYKAGDKVSVKVIDIKDGKISLSIKALKMDPWQEAAAKYKKDDIVSAAIIKFNKYGALASIEEGVAGLVHVSEFEHMDALRAVLDLGKVYKFKITLFEPKERKMTLSYKEANA